MFTLINPKEIVYASTKIDNKDMQTCEFYCINSGCAAYVFLAILPYSRVISQVSDPLGEAYEMRRLSQEAVIHHES